MNEVKAFIRKRKAEEVVDGLEAEGYCCMTVLEVMGLGRMSDPNKTQLSVSIAERFTDIVKLVIVCDDKDADNVVSIIQNHARSGQPGDGIIYVTPVSKSVHIRTGKTGGAFLQIERY